MDATNCQEMDLGNITNVEIEGIDTSDYPDFCDAFIANAEWEDTGEALSDKEVEALNSHYPDFVYEQVWESLY